MRSILSRQVDSRRWLGALALALACCACGRGTISEPDAVPPPTLEASDDREPAADEVRIVFLGDSLSAGYGLAAADAFPALVEARLREEGYRVRVINAGVSGDTTAGGVSRLDWVLRSEPQLLVIELGGNDALRGQPLENTERNLREIVRRGRAAGARVILLGMDVPTSYGPQYAGGFAALFERVASDESVELVPGFIREVGMDPSLMQADGLHPTAEGHRRLAEMLVPRITTMVEEIAE